MKRTLRMLLCIIGSIMLVACSEKEEGTEMSVYYVDVDENELVQAEYMRTSTEVIKSVEELIEALENPDDPKKFSSAIPENVEIEDFRINGKQLELVFSEEYYEMNKSREVLLRGAVVQTMVQIPNINYVSFYIGDDNLKDSSGSVVGLMCAEDFVQNIGSSLKSYQSTDLNLYFASKEGTTLNIEKRTDIHYNINTSIEKLVVEQLMKGTTSDKRSSTISSSVKLLSVSVKDGICYVNFDSAFLSSGYDRKPEVTVYSIVNSIIANGNATKVQILVEGSSDVTYMGSMSLRNPLEWNANLIEE